MIGKVTVCDQLALCLESIVASSAKLFLLKVNVSIVAIKSFTIIELPVVASDAIGVLFGWRIEQMLSLLFF